jgi:hypothetical protein
MKSRVIVAALIACLVTVGVAQASEAQGAGIGALEISLANETCGSNDSCLFNTLLEAHDYYAYQRSALADAWGNDCNNYPSPAAGFPGGCGAYYNDWDTYHYAAHTILMYLIDRFG